MPSGAPPVLRTFLPPLEVLRTTPCEMPGGSPVGFYPDLLYATLFGGSIYVASLSYGCRSTKLPEVPDAVCSFQAVRGCVVERKRSAIAVCRVA